MEKNLNFIGDNPINDAADDLFNFEPYALKVQKLLQSNTNNPNPITVGIYGKWGEGKTSFLNLIENKIDLWKKSTKDKGILKYHFNPWRYSTEEEMLFDFFDGLSKSMYVGGDTNLRKVGKGILKFSKYLKAVKISASVGISSSNKISATFQPSEILKALGEDFVGKDITLDKLKDEVNNALSKANYKIIVFIDDIDRLDKDEIYTILKLVKLNASFNNFVYVITLDSEQVSKAISKRYGSNKKDGKFFLEKIVNIPIHIPRIEDADLKNFFDKKIVGLVKGLSFLDKEIKESELNEIRNSFYPEYFETAREIIRIFNSFFVSAFAIGDEVNLYDLFWVEYLKIKYPKTFESIKNYSHSNRLVLSFSEILDFNDEINAQKAPNGKRLELQKISKKGFQIVEMLFPVEVKSGVVGANSFDIGKRKRELRVNTLTNFDKYFSYHTVRKVSNIEIVKLKKAVKEEDKERTLEFIENIKHQSENQLHKFFYVIEELSKTLKEEDGRNFWFKFLVLNLKTIPQVGKDLFGLDYDTRLIELISTELNKEENNKELILDIGDKLDYDNLCHFTRKFDETKGFKVKLEIMVIDKLKRTNYIEEPFFSDSRKSSNRFVMHYWKKHYSEEYEDFLKKVIDSLERIGQFLRVFVEYWNNSFYGNITVEGFKALKRLSSAELIFSKINNLSPDIVKLVKVTNPDFSDHEEKTVTENIKQFVYHYLNDKDS